MNKEHQIWDLKIEQRNMLVSTFHILDIKVYYNKQKVCKIL